MQDRDHQGVGEHPPHTQRVTFEVLADFVVLAHDQRCGHRDRGAEHRDHDAQRNFPAQRQIGQSAHGVGTTAAMRAISSNKVLAPAVKPSSRRRPSRASPAGSAAMFSSTLRKRASVVGGTPLRATKGG